MKFVTGKNKKSIGGSRDNVKKDIRRDEMTSKQEKKRDRRMKEGG